MYELFTSLSFNVVVFLPFDAMHKRDLCRHAVSVCLSVTFVSCVKTNKRIIKFFSLSGCHTILVFFTPNGIAILRREPPPSGASNAGGVGRNRDSELISGFNACCYRCNMPCVVNTVADGPRLSSRKL